MAEKLKILPRELEDFLKDGNIEECKRVFSQCELNATSWSGSNVFSLVPMPGEFAFWAKEQGADIHFRDRLGQTPIFETARMDGDICKILLDKGAVITDRSRQFVSAFSEAFHRHNSKKKSMKSYQNHLAALEKLCKLFDVEMLPESPVHDGVSPIIVTDFLSFKNNFEELWEFLVPSRGQAQTAQGEVIRIAGRITDELMRNGGLNWDEDYRKMLYCFGEYCSCGNPFYWIGRSVDEIINALKDGDVDDLMIEMLRTCAVHWVRSNPEVMPLLKTDYTR